MPAMTGFWTSSPGPLFWPLVLARLTGIKTWLSTLAGFSAARVTTSCFWFRPCWEGKRGQPCAVLEQDRAMTDLSPNLHRVDWVDYAKGICIVLVVLMHSTLGVEKAMGETGTLHIFIQWAQPFRMPDFFLISGLFLARRIDVPWRDYLDKKVVHFLYFYLLWMTIQFLFKGYGIWQEQGAFGLGREYALAFLEPFGTLWFIYLLPIFFVVTKLAHRVPPLLVFVFAAALEMAPIHTGWIMIDEFAARFVFFFAGYWLAGHVFRFANHMAGLSTAALLSALLIWGFAHTEAFRFNLVTGPGLGLFFGFIGTAAVVSAGVLLSRFRISEAIRYLGENSIVVYLSFFVFMATARAIAIRVAPGLGPDVISLAVTLAGLVGPVLLFWVSRKLGADFLFRRPRNITWPLRPKLETTPKVWHSAGHDNILKQSQTR